MNPETERRVRVLLIEDDPDSAFLVSLHLNEACGETMRFTLQTAATLAQGVELLGREAYDAVLLDLLLPDSQGLETFLALRARAPETPIVILTGLADEETAFKAVAEGAQDFLVKEKLEARLLRRALAYALERSRLAARLREIERLESEIQQRRRVEEFKDQVISAVSHELRSPLTVVKAAVANLWDGLAGPLQEPQAKLVYIALRNIHRLTRLIDNFLDLSRLEAGRVKAVAQKFEPARLMRETVEGMRLACGTESRVEIAVDIPPDLPLFENDPDIFLQVVGNLLDNALRYARSRVRLSARVEGGAAVVAVEDDGPGIPPERMGDLFNKFVQINRPNAGGGYKGTGLGLAICRELAELCGGELAAESPPGGGARFQFKFPVRLKTEEGSHAAGGAKARAHR